MTRGSTRGWLVFIACAAAIVLALCWVTREILGLQKREAQARHEARLQEAIRLALWRIDSAFAPVVAQESVRPPSDYPEPGGAGLPQSCAFAPFKLYFSIDGTGRSSAPEVAPFVPALCAGTTAMVRDQKAESSPTLPASRPAGEGDYRYTSVPADEEKRLFYEAQLPPPPMPNPVAPNAQMLNMQPQGGAISNRLSPIVDQLSRSKDEYQVRARMTQQVEENYKAQAFNNPVFLNLQMAVPAAMDVTSALRARFLPGNELFFARTVTDRTSRATRIQGIWCDWTLLERWLLDQARDLLPAARLEPVVNPAADDGSLLASVPARFVPGPIEYVSDSTSSTLVVVIAAWAAALVAIASVGGVLHASMNLGERRGRFVSAVTHELRTPLTTFRMYAQMLADGMVSKDAQAEYLATLRDESERLARVVESVLLYSRLEEGRGGAHREIVRCAALLDRALPIVRKRAQEGGMRADVTVVLPDEARVDVDPQAVEQILLNLVDNACKYALPANPRLEVACRVRGHLLEVAVRDHGPGIAADERAAVFLPFQRGARDAAGTTPGVGLGLALALGLARALRGDLELEPAAPGARFVLTIPLV